MPGFSGRDRAAAWIASRQRTLVTREQLAGCGLGKDAIAYRVASGRLGVVFGSVYSVGCGELPPLALELAALLACGERSFISHGSAAFVWGMRKTAPARVDVSVVGRNCWLRKGLRVHRIQAIDRRELRRHEGLWVSSPARAVLEVAAVGSLADVGDLVDEGVARRLLTAGELEAVLERNRGRRGAARLAAVIGQDAGRGISRTPCGAGFPEVDPRRAPAPSGRQPTARSLRAGLLVA